MVTVSIKTAQLEWSQSSMGMGNLVQTKVYAWIATDWVSLKEHSMAPNQWRLDATTDASDASLQASELKNRL
jgi:hypothetical protein